jgi:hypothetical protein
MKVLFDKPVKEVLDIIIGKGLAHHSSAVYGDYNRPVRLFAKMNGWEVVE